MNEMNWVLIKLVMYDWAWLDENHIEYEQDINELTVFFDKPIGTKKFHTSREFLSYIRALKDSEYGESK